MKEDLVSLSSLSRILIVDSEHAVRSTLQTILRREGYDVMSAGDAESGSISAQSWQPDVVIAEIILTGTSGLEFASEIVRLYPGCRVVLFSGQVAPALIDKAISLGFDFFYKPVPPTVLIDRLKVLLQE